MSSSSTHSQIQAEASPSDPPSYQLIQGTAPLLVSVPHSGSLIPPDIQSQMTEFAVGSIDSDWFMNELYLPIVKRLRGSLIVPLYSRYVIDLNRPKTDKSLYPGQTTTGLCPLQRFDGHSLYPLGKEPTQLEKDSRLKHFWLPYHQALQEEINRLVQVHGHVLLWEGHSIRSIVPRLFEGQLPDFNIGTNQGQSCDQSIESAVSQMLSTQSDYSFVVNGRFKGGYITRAYGQPHQGVHAVQLELSQVTYLQDELKPKWSSDYANKVTQVIESIMQVALSTVKSMSSK